MSFILTLCALSLLLVCVRSQNSIACGSNQPQVLRSRRGSLVSPGYGNGGYTEENSCSWVIDPKDDLVSSLHYWNKVTTITFLGHQIDLCRV